jgi:hypothetical protein
MDRTWRFSIARLLVVTALVGVAIAGWTKAARLQHDNERLNSLHGPLQRMPNDNYLRGQPLSIMMSDRYGLGVNAVNWYASVDITGAGQLEVENLGTVQRSSFQVSESQLAAFREALIAEEFFYLPNEVGELVPDGGAESLTVVVGDRAKTLRINFLANLANTPGRYRAADRMLAAQAVRLWIAARSWIDPRGAYDDLGYARRILPRLDPRAAPEKSDAKPNN